VFTLALLLVTGGLGFAVYRAASRRLPWYTQRKIRERSPAWSQ